MERQGSRLVRIGLIAFGFILVAANLSFSVESIGYVRDGARDHNRAIEANLESLTRQLKEARDERTGIASFTPTTDDQITAAQHAVDEAIVARQQECKPVGDNCRKRVIDEQDRERELGRLQSNKSIGDRAAVLDAKITDLDAKIRRIGPAPLAQDPVAARLAGITFGWLTADEIAEKLPIAWSLVAELCAFFGPWIFRQRP